ncbi:hypothetical protein ATANTOWER_010714, partial [Ataeniobius toweri]|nr:hypothetical protein [Ataeniobius toweri]
MRPRRHLMINSTSPLRGFKKDVLRWNWPLSLESHRVSSAGCKRDTERHRSGRPLATSLTDGHFVVNSALQNRMMNATQLQAHFRRARGTQVSRQTILNPIPQLGLHVRRPTRVPDHNTRHRHHCLVWSIYAGQKTSGSQYCSLMGVDSREGEMMAANDVGDVKESAMHQSLLSPDETSVVVVLQCGQVCL